MFDWCRASLLTVTKIVGVVSREIQEIKVSTIAHVLEQYSEVHLLKII